MQERNESAQHAVKARKAPYSPPEVQILGTVNELTRDWDVSLG